MKGNDKDYSFQTITGRGLFSPVIFNLELIYLLDEQAGVEVWNAVRQQAFRTSNCNLRLIIV